MVTLIHNKYMQLFWQQAYSKKYFNNIRCEIVDLPNMDALLYLVHKRQHDLPPDHVQLPNPQ